MKKYRFIVPLLGIGLFIFVSCSNSETSSSSAPVDSTNDNSPESLQPEPGQPNSSTFNPNANVVPADVVKGNTDSLQRKDSLQKKHK